MLFFFLCTYCVLASRLLYVTRPFSAGFVVHQLMKCLRKAGCQLPVVEHVCVCVCVCSATKTGTLWRANECAPVARDVLYISLKQREKGRVTIGSTAAGLT